MHFSWHFQVRSNVLPTFWALIMWAKWPTCLYFLLGSKTTILFGVWNFFDAFRLGRRSQMPLWGLYLSTKGLPRMICPWKNLVAEPKNVRPGLCYGGFTSYMQASIIAYSCWSNIVTPYNLSLETCKKKSYIFLSFLIPVPLNPKVEIDVYL